MGGNNGFIFQAIGVKQFSSGMLDGETEVM